MLTDEQIEGWRMLLLDCNSFYSEQHAEIHALCDQAKAANRYVEDAAKAKKRIDDFRRDLNREAEALRGEAR